MKNIFDWLKAINNTKPPVESFTSKDWEVWNSYMIHRFMSMNPDYIEIVNTNKIINPNAKINKYKSDLKRVSTSQETSGILPNQLLTNQEFQSKEGEEHARVA